MMEASELIERLEKATAADRNLDAALHVALVKPEQRADDLRYFRVPSASMDHMEMCAPGTYWLKERSGASLQTAPAYTASLDAALSLVERVLPGFAYGLRTCAVWAPHHQWAGKPVWEAVVTDMGDCDCYYPWGDPDETDDVVEHEASHCSPALALCLALLRASPTEEPALPPQAPSE